MSDSSKYVNTYIDVVSNTLHQYLNEILQLRTQLKISNDLVSEKDQVITSLQKEQEKNTTVDKNIDEYKNQAASWESQFNALKSKVSHMDTLSNQLIDMKRAVVDRDTEIQNLKISLAESHKTIASLESIINKRRKNVKKNNNILFTEPKNDVDDF